MTACNIGEHSQEFSDDTAPYLNSDLHTMSVYVVDYIIPLTRNAPNVFISMQACDVRMYIVHVSVYTVILNSDSSN